jgi:hypothetical protein
MNLRTSPSVRGPLLPFVVAMSGRVRARRSRPAGGHFLLLAQKKVTKEEGLNTICLADVAADQRGLSNSVERGHTRASDGVLSENGAVVLWRAAPGYKPARRPPRPSSWRATGDACRAAVVPAGAGPIRGVLRRRHGRGGVDEVTSREARWSPASVGRRTRVPPATCDHVKPHEGRRRTATTGRKPPVDIRGLMRREPCEARWSN